MPYVAYGLASVVSAARFTAQKHYASDIVAGAAMVWFIGRYVYQIHENHAAHQWVWARPQMPSVEPATGSYLVSVRFWKLNLGVSFSTIHDPFSPPCLCRTPLHARMLPW